MSRSLASVLKTDSLKPLAQILRSKGRKGDTILAHISPKEAARLKREGGSGTINPDTGLPEFFGEDGFDYPTFDVPAAAAPVEAPVGSAMIYDQPVGPVQQGYSGYQQSGDTSLVNIPQGTYAPELAGSRYDTGYSPQAAMTQAASYQPETFTPVGSASIYDRPIGPDIAAIAGAAGSPGFDPRGATEEGQKLLADINKQGADQKTPAEKGLFGDLISNKNALGLGILGAGGLMGYLNQQKAAGQAKDAAAQIQAAYAAAAQQQKDLAAPLVGPGYTQLSQALQGTLSPANQQAMQAAQARVAQASAKSGGVGAVQASLQEEAFRQQLLGQQQQQALALLAPGNAMIQAAINAQLQGTTQSLSTRLGLEQQANSAAMGLYAALGSAVGGGLMKSA